MARERHVFHTSEIPHLWAHRAQDDARNQQGNLFFNGDTIYSYGSHFPIARHVYNQHNEHAVLFTTRNYSNTTAKHTYKVRAAIPRNVPVFTTAHVSAPPEQLASEYARRIELFEKAARQNRGLALHDRVDKADQLRDEANRYARFFDTGHVFREPDDWAELRAEADIKEARRREKQAERDRIQREEIARRYAEYEQRQKKTLGERIAGWRAGGNPYIYDAEPTMLRINGDEVETSRGARFPLSHARPGIALVNKTVATGKEWTPNGHTLHLGHYAIDKIDADGTVHAGCHLVPYAEVKRIEQALAAPKAEQESNA
jgi:hypothetical protein